MVSGTFILVYFNVLMRQASAQNANEVNDLRKAVVWPSKLITMAKKDFAENKNYVKPYLTLSDFHKDWTIAKVYCVAGWV